MLTEITTRRTVRVKGAVLCERPSRPTIAELRAVGQPASVTGRRTAEHWTADAYLRKWSPYVTAGALRAGLSANAMTWLMIITGNAAAVAVMFPSWWTAVLAMLLTQLQMLWDASDGEVARWRGTSGATGVFLDKLGHYSTETGIAVALGIRAAGGPLEIGEQPWYLVGGLALALFVALNKAMNDAVHVARAMAGFSRLEDSETVAAPRQKALASLRKVAKFLPFHRMFHSVELTMIIAVVAVVDVVAGDVSGASWLLAVLVTVSPLVLLGHLLAVLTSARLR